MPKLGDKIITTGESNDLIPLLKMQLKQNK